MNTNNRKFVLPLETTSQMEVMKVARLTIVVLSVIVISLSFTCISSVRVDQKSIVGVWLFDEGKGEVAKDSSENGNSGELMNGTKWVSGKFGKAIELDGVDDYIDAPDSPSLSVGGGSITIQFWTKLNGPSRDEWVRKNPTNDWQPCYDVETPDGGSKIRWLYGTGSEIDFQSKNSLDLKVWQHVAVTYDASTDEARIYINGNLDNSIISDVATFDTDEKLQIGRHYRSSDGATGGYVDGLIDEVGIFNVALKEEEIQTIMDEGLNSMLAVASAGKITTTWADIKK